jgi:DNA polymerase-4
MEKVRKIIHIDMDAFFAAVEMRDNPKLRGKPVVVGGDPQSRGVVSTCSYQARKFGIHSAMSAAMAYRLCPHAIFVRPRFAAYKEASEQILDIFFQYTDLVEPMSLDEAYLDVTSSANPSATKIAKQIKQDIYAKTKLTASAGVSFNKFLAKIASDMKKPDGLVVIPPSKAAKILQELPIGKFHGIGQATQQKMQRLGINNGKDLLQWQLPDLIRHFGKMGNYFYNVVRGIDNRPVKTERVRKSIGKENTFSYDLEELVEMNKYLKSCSKQIAEKMKQLEVKAKTVTLKIKYADFTINTRSVSFTHTVDSANLLYSTTKNLLQQHLNSTKKVRLLGISVSNLVWKNRTEQLILPFYEKYSLTDS